MSAARAHAIGFGVAAALGVAACSALPFGPRAIGACAGELRSSREIADEFVARIRLHVVGDRVDAPMQLIVQSHAGELVLIGVNPLGAKLFTIVQRGLDIDVDALPASVLPIEPSNILRDVHRVRFLSAAAPTGSATTASARYGDTRVDELWQSGRLVRRSFSALPDGPESSRVEYSATRASVWNPQCGYRIEMETLSEQTLEGIAQRDR